MLLTQICVTIFLTQICVKNGNNLRFLNPLFKVLKVQILSKEVDESNWDISKRERF